MYPVMVADHSQSVHPMRAGNQEPSPPAPLGCINAVLRHPRCRRPPQGGALAPLTSGVLRRAGQGRSLLRLGRERIATFLDHRSYVREPLAHRPLNWSFRLFYRPHEGEADINKNMGEKPIGNPLSPFPWRF